MLQCLRFKAIPLCALLQVQSFAKNYGTISTTLRGELVKSIGEKKIADFLYVNLVKYEYDKEINLGNKVLRPDFYLPTFDTYIEYFGLYYVNDGALRRQYRKQAAWKTEMYSLYKIKCISLFPDNVRTPYNLSFSLKRFVPYPKLTST